MNKLSMVITVAGWSCCGAAAAADTPLPLLVQPNEARADFRPLLADRNRRYSSIAEFETHMGRAEIGRAHV